MAKNCEKLFYTRNVGYQKKGIDPLNSDKVILAVSDVLYEREREKNAKIGRKIVFIF